MNLSAALKPVFERMVEAGDDIDDCEFAQLYEFITEQYASNPDYYDDMNGNRLIGVMIHLQQIYTNMIQDYALRDEITFQQQQEENKFLFEREEMRVWK